MELPPRDRAELSQILHESLMSDQETAIATEWNEIAEIVWTRSSQERRR